MFQLVKMMNNVPHPKTQKRPLNKLQRTSKSARKEKRAPTLLNQYLRNLSQIRTDILSSIRMSCEDILTFALVQTQQNLFHFIPRIYFISRSQFYLSHSVGFNENQNMYSLLQQIFGRGRDDVLLIWGYIIKWCGIYQLSLTSFK